MLKTWIYHESQKPIVIDLSVYDKYKNEGWRDSPASFVNHSDVGISTEKLEQGDTDEAFKAQQVKDTIDGITEYLNCVINLDTMKKQELCEFAEKHLDKKLNQRMLKAKLIDKIRGHISDDC